MKLISMLDFVIEITKIILDESISEIEKLYILKNYAQFLSQKLELWMFVPCKLVDGVWVVLECPHNYGLLHTYPTGHILIDESFKDALEYQEAKENCIFEGFNLDYDRIVKNKEIRIQFNDFSIYLNNSSAVISIIEDLVKHNLELTKTAQKQLS